jgi:hypothetical protein
MRNFVLPGHIVLIIAVEIRDSLAEGARAMPEISETQIAVGTKEAANSTRGVIVIDAQEAERSFFDLCFRLLTDSADAALRDPHPFVFAKTDAVVFLEIPAAIMVAIGFSGCTIVSDTISARRNFMTRRGPLVISWANWHRCVHRHYCIPTLRNFRDVLGKRFE